MSKNNDILRTGMPLSHNQIRLYWADIIDFDKKTHCTKYEFINGDFIDGYFCFACGLSDDGIERAHIKPICEGGNNNIDNIHLLCRTCHKRSEFISGKEYFDWFYQRRDIDSMVTRALINNPYTFSELLSKKLYPCKY